MAKVQSEAGLVGRADSHDQLADSRRKLSRDALLVDRLVAMFAGEEFGIIVGITPPSVNPATAVVWQAEVAVGQPDGVGVHR